MILLNQFLKWKNFQKFQKLLFILILDEKCDKIGEDEKIFISFQFYGGYHSLIHYKENITHSKLFNDNKKKIVIKQDHCHTQYLINYFDIQNNDDIRILDLEYAIGNMNLYKSNQIEGVILVDYF